MTKRATQRETVEAAAPEPVRYTVQEALAKAAERRDARMGRKPAAEAKAAAKKRAAAVVDEVSDQTDDRYTSMEFIDLQQEAKQRELSAGGSADALRARLREADAATDADPAPVAPAEVHETNQ